MITSRSPHLRAALVGVSAVLVGATVLAACGDDGSSRNASGTVRIEASFYPLAWMAEQVGGDHVDVSSVTKPGAEPHDLELTPADVAAVSDADLVVYVHGFQPSLDEAVAEAGRDKVFDAADSADLDLTFTPIEEGKAATDESGSVDPHFWLDPTRLTAVAAAFTDKLAKVDPDHAADYRTNLATFTGKLTDLDGRLRTGLASCANKDLVTSHNAFGYLARRYGLHQVGITGLTPEEEPSPTDLADVTRYVEAHHVRTIYFETLVSPAIAKTVADEAGVATEVLDPIEGLSDASQGKDYLEVMTSNLANLRKGQPCT
jgi:zinc transport system substrate-binding protein